MTRLFKPATAAATLVALALSACTTNPQTGQTEISKTALYGLGGAAACGLVGALTHGGKGARNSALACGAIGAGIGGYMDYQEKQLREKLKNSQIAVERIGDQLKLSLPDNITFPTNGYQLNARVQKPLGDIAGVLVQFPDTSITVAGHTDSTGAAAYNQTLSEKRAQSVTEYLQGQGVNSVRVRTMGYGTTQPVASNASESGKAKNRRVEIMITPQQMG
ncbi:OmpA family protein [Chromobacterium haemolyticum]|uniref:OmpA family protein n=1 Tax=Chromobacterium haemolyticum TaxID=394935 RepID=UPI00244D45DC|nr:OmpA family protein [Chromobacterium haemolyticum]MDH0341654.1 OmpA family protein [Chromobacterium haemolyticum]